MNKSNQNFSPAPYHSSNDSNILFKINTSLGSYDIMTFDNNSFIDEKDNTISNFPIYEQEKIKADDNDFIQKKKTKILYKFRDDHLKRKCKHLVIESAIEFINKKISEVYGGDIGEGLLKKKLLKLNQEIIKKVLFIYESSSTNVFFFFLGFALLILFLYTFKNISKLS